MATSGCGHSQADHAADDLLDGTEPSGQSADRCYGPKTISNVFDSPAPFSWPASAIANWA